MMIAAILAPFLMLVFLGYAFGGTISHARVAFVQDSFGPVSSSLLESLRNEQTCSSSGTNCENAFSLTNVPDLDAAKRMLRDGLVEAIVYVPLGFEQSTASNRHIAVYVDNTDPLSAATISSQMSSVSLQFSVTPSSSMKNVDLIGFYRNVQYTEFMAPGSIIQAIMTASIIGGGIAILNDKQNGVIEGYLVTPLKQYEIVVGFLLAGVTKAIFSAGAMLFLAIIFAGVHPNVDLSGFLMIMFTLFLTALGIISMMTAYAVRMPNRDVYQFTVFPLNMILYFTSGAIYPIQGFPGWMRQISVINPEAYAVHALRMLMYKGASLPAVLGDFAFLAVFTTLMLALATFAFRRGL
jgi:ABC-2 type transport system permease protein